MQQDDSKDVAKCIGGVPSFKPLDWLEFKRLIILSADEVWENRNTLVGVEFRRPFGHIQDAKCTAVHVHRGTEQKYSLAVLLAIAEKQRTACMVIYVGK